MGRKEQLKRAGARQRRLSQDERRREFVAKADESFNTDIHARDHRCRDKIGVKRDGTFTAFE